ncbi:MAG TPA: T9SS type A sorting domain-containing protein [Bacteroidota bacterium]|nr:T9SS type A sorting domain-containing protein [Bacteroidota bacterium]
MIGRIIFLLLLFMPLGFLVPSPKMVQRRQTELPLDSLSIISHEKYFEQFYRLNPQLLGRPSPPILHGPSSTVTFPNVNISGDTFPQNEPSIRISHKNPNRMVAAWRDFRTGVNPAVRRVAYSFSEDGGTSWASPQLLPLVYQPDYTRNTDPAVCVDTSGKFYIATIALNDADQRTKILVYQSDAHSDFFAPAYFAPTDTSYFDYYDKDYIACDLSPISPFVNNLYIVWQGVRFTRSTDGGVTWSKSLLVSDSLSHSYVPDLCVGPDGAVNIASQRFPTGPVDRNPMLVFNHSTDGGISFGSDMIVDSIYIRDSNCTFRGPRGIPSIAADLSSGPTRGYLYIVWADARNGDDDVFLTESSDGGNHWSKARRVNDDPAGNGKCQYWPWIAVDDRGVVTIVYYDNRGTLADSLSETYLAYSWDAGDTFTNRLISAAQSPHVVPNGAVRFGDYIGIDSWGGHTVPVWTDERAGGYDMDIYTAVLDTLPQVTFAGLSFPVSSGWNIVSIPTINNDLFKTHLFPTSTSPAFAYEGSYAAVESLRHGPGYWLAFAQNQQVRIIGDSLFTDSIGVTAGWNMIGSISAPIDIHTIMSDPGGIVTSRFFGYTQGYQHADTIEPGEGYWVKTNQGGKLILSSSTSVTSMNRIRVTPTADLPPAPPEGVDVQRLTPKIADRYSLEQNFPNPFNPATEIRYVLPEKGHIRIIVYDVLGRAVGTLVDANQQVGYNEVTFDARNLPSGVYFYRLLAEKFVEVKKMLLMR